MCESIGKSVYSDYSKTELQSKTFIYTWKIEHFQLHVPVSSNSSSFLDSTSKVLGENGKTLWHVYLDLNHYTGDHKIRVTVFINRDIAKLNPKYCNYVSLHIVKADGNEHQVQENKNVSCDRGEIVFEQNKNEILCKNSKLLSNGDLTLKFRLCSAVGEVITHSDPAVFLDLDLNKPKQSVGFENLLNNKKFSDVKIIVGDKQFFAYKGILADRSPVFAAMFEHNMKESIDSVVEVTDVDYETMNEVLRFIYAGKVNNIEGMTSKLLAAADKYEIEDLELMCEKILINTLNVNTVTSLLIFAEKYSTKILKKSALDFFKLHAKEIVKNENYRKDINDLLPILPEIFDFIVS